ncbi:MAG: 4-alpha-glucanotransferase [Desulfobacterales bacterium]|nr:4-alpha-glucanotransferase [Desulfobacterales bacterium]MDD4073281.1 4-alpha-glucanotransferase [Desulfobacterales bacterium]MDD4391946.1 4-alpha-glucanotransferase [Desulfobacterales bacterium]
MTKRSSGILLHITSLPSDFGIGDLGPGAYGFADFLAQTRQSVWQLLPLNPVEVVHGCSPYYSTSAFAGNELLISPEFLVRDGLLKQSELDSRPQFPKDRVDFKKTVSFKKHLLELAYERFKTLESHADFDRFCRYHAGWLDDFSLFTVLRSHFRGKIWAEWPAPLRDRLPGSLEVAAIKLADALNREKFFQYMFHLQWTRLKRYCNLKRIQLLGDIPIYMPYDSADLWIHPDIFKLDEHKKPIAVSGVPPDYFSRTGQLWGHPVYNWTALIQLGYSWWIHRIRHNLALYDRIRIDHFRGFCACWEVPASELTAQNGKWVDTPGIDFFNQLIRIFPCLPVIAEDLGTITADVRELMHQFGFPGMKILEFAFGDDFPASAYMPHNLPKHCVVYTGTHDNDTVRGWFEDPENSLQRLNLYRYLGRKVPVEEIHREMIRMAMMSTADLSIIPMQDILGMGTHARMNQPARKTGNWQWRLCSDQITPETIDMLLEMTHIYERV